MGLTKLLSGLRSILVGPKTSSHSTKPSSSPPAVSNSQPEQTIPPPQTQQRLPPSQVELDSRPLTPKWAITTLKAWDKGVFAAELVDQSLIPRKIKADREGDVISAPNVPPSLSVGTFNGTKKAATEMFRRIEDRFGSYFDIANFESTVPQALAFDVKKVLYQYQAAGSDKYPPHLDLIPLTDQVSLLQIFNFMNLLDTGSLLGRVIPDDISDFIHGHPNSDTIAGMEARNQTLREDKFDIFVDPNIGDRKDWFSDAVFASQQFVGTNPTTIELASGSWIEQFKTAAKTQSNDQAFKLLDTASPKSIYIQDYSYFRKSVGVDATAPLVCEDASRFGCAAVSLFHLSDDGALHPLAIILDYKGSIDASVVVFNKRLSATDPTDSEAADWPWRFAKTCAQAADWTRHEITVHLVDCHFIEEATIVAAHRSFENDHIVYRLLQPHWLKTLSLNAAARSSLVPEVVVKLVGMSEPQLYEFVADAYARFDWTAKYIPVDLENRGFPVNDLNSAKFHNYVYGKNMLLMWNTLRTFVSSVIATVYTTDDQVAADSAVTAWSTEMQSAQGGQLSSFPLIKTVDQLVDAVTMCIHIASPQHTAVNYLQEYYQSFVIAKPPALFAPLPTTLEEVLKYTEKDLVTALPATHPREWLLASHLPNLLSQRVSEDQNLVNYAVSLFNLSVQKKDTAIANAASVLYSQLVDLTKVFDENSKAMDDQTLPYTVMNPSFTAVSILA